MTVLTKDRETAYRPGEDYHDPVAAAVVVFAGALCVLDAAGNLAPGSTATGLVARGVAQEYVDNSDGAAGDLSASTRSGTFRFINEGDIDRTHIGDDAYITDDQTVTAVATGRSVAGKIDDVDSYGVWVKVGK